MARPQRVEAVRRWDAGNRRVTCFLSTPMLAMMLLAYLAGGCSSQSREESKKGSASTQRPTRGGVVAREPHSYEHDAGEVLAGEELCHTFVFRNPLAEPIAVRGDEDIRKTCGCASLELSRKQLEPGNQTEVTVRVATRGRVGRIRYGGVVTWRSEKLATLPARFEICGEVLPVLEVTPNHLAFTRQEVADGVTKELTFSSRLPVDWTTFSVTASSPHARVVALNRDGQGARCTLRFVIPAGLPDVSADIFGRARVSNQSQRLGGSEVSTFAHATAQHSVELAWKPELLTLQYDPSVERASGLVIFWGDKVTARHGVIGSVEWGGRKAHFTAIPSAGNAVLVKFAFGLAPAEVPSAIERLRVAISGEECIELPFVVSRFEPRARS